MSIIISKIKNEYRPNIVFSYLGILIYRITLEFIYKYQINPEWAYSGFTIDYSIKSYSISWVALLLSIPFIIKNYKKNKTSNAIMTIFYLIAYIPGTVLMGYKPMKDEFLLFYLLYWLILTISQNTVPYFKIKRISTKDSMVIFNLTLIMLSAVVLFVSYYYTGFRLNFSIFNVYELRSEASEYNMPVLLTYLFSASRAIFPTLIVYKLSSKKYKTALLLGFIQFLIFSVDGSKSVLFSLLLAFIGYGIYKKNRTSWFVWGLSLINFVAILEKLILNSTYVMGIFIRRMLFLPQLLNYFYYDFFSKNEFDYFRQSIIGKLGFESPYSIRIPNIIGGTYYGSSANNGLFADAYYNLGLIGILLMPILVILALRFLDACSDKINIRLLIASIITSSLNLISSSFFTVMLSHGFIAVCFVLYMLPRNEEVFEHKNTAKKSGVKLVGKYNPE